MDKGQIKQFFDEDSDSNYQPLQGVNSNQDSDEENNFNNIQNKIFMMFDLKTLDNFSNQLNVSIINIAKRTIEILEIQENQSLTNLESIILQNSSLHSYSPCQCIAPERKFDSTLCRVCNNVYSNEEQINSINGFDFFQLIYFVPELENLNMKIKNITTQQKLKTIQLKRDEKQLQTQETEAILNQILKSPLKIYLKEYEFQSALQLSAFLIKLLNLHSDLTNDNEYKLQIYNFKKYMRLDNAAINALSIFKTSNVIYSLFDYLNQCKTIIGKRQLEKYLRQPLQDEKSINQRLDIVQLVLEKENIREFLQNQFFRSIPDLQKLFYKFYKIFSKKPCPASSLQDIVKVYQLVKQLIKLKQFFSEQLQSQNIYASSSPKKNQQQIPELTKYNQTIELLLGQIEDILEDFKDLENLVEKFINLEQCKKKKEFRVRARYSQSMKNLANQIQDLLNQMNSICFNLKQTHNIKLAIVDSKTHVFAFDTDLKSFKKAKNEFNTLKIGKENLIEIKQNKNENEIIFTTPSMIQISEQIEKLNQQYDQEQKIAEQKILSIVSTYHPVMEQAEQFIANLDVLTSFAEVISKFHKRDFKNFKNQISFENQLIYSRPLIITNIEQQNNKILLQKSFHPLLFFQTDDATQVVSNDIDIETNQMHIITGPNMGGKSTYLRQIAICVILAHIGCYVPAEYAELPIIDSIITRVGATDIQIRGISTFMNEMLETASITQSATKDSLLLIDELGRGTSTQDGYGISYALIKFIIEKIGGYSLFATNFFELTNISTFYQNQIKNFHVEYHQNKMIYKIKEGSSNHTFGIQVAKMLKINNSILEQAQKKLDFLLSTYKDLENKNNSQLENNKINNEDDDDIISSKQAQSQAERTQNKQTREIQLQVVELTQQYVKAFNQIDNNQQKQQLIKELKQRIYDITQQDNQLNIIQLSQQQFI